MQIIKPKTEMGGSGKLWGAPAPQSTPNGAIPGQNQISRDQLLYLLRYFLLQVPQKLFMETTDEASEAENRLIHQNSETTLLESLVDSHYSVLEGL